MAAATEALSLHVHEPPAPSRIAACHMKIDLPDRATIPTGRLEYGAVPVPSPQFLLWLRESSIGPSIVKSMRLCSYAC